MVYATKRKKRLHWSERGMTLIEIMVVVIIIGLVASVVGVQVFKVLGDAQAKAAKVQMKSISDALELYKLSNRKYPTTSEGLQALTVSKGGGKPFLQSIPEDPWGNDYVYLYPGQHNSGGFDLMSYGEDGVQGGNDDITNWDHQKTAEE